MTRDELFNIVTGEPAPVNVRVRVAVRHSRRSVRTPTIVRPCAARRRTGCGRRGRLTPDEDL